MSTRLKKQQRKGTVTLTHGAGSVHTKAIREMARERFLEKAKKNEDS